MLRDNVSVVENWAFPPAGKVALLVQMYKTPSTTTNLAIVNISKSSTPHNYSFQHLKSLDNGIKQCVERKKPNESKNMFENQGLKNLLADKKKLLGLLFIFLVALIWVVASFVVQGIEAVGAHPAVLTVVANSLFAIYLPIYYLNIRLKQRWRRERGAEQQELHNLMSPQHPRSDVGGVLRLEDLAQPPQQEMSHRDLLHAAMVVSLRSYCSVYACPTTVIGVLLCIVCIL